jgi:hypothetical protein
MIKIQPYKVGDIGKLDPMPGAFDLYAQHDLSALVDTEQRPMHMNVITISKDGDPIAVICWYFMWEGVVELLAITDKKVKSNAIPFAKCMKEWMDAEILQKRIRRVQTTLRASFPQGQKWLSFLGMEQEGLLRKFCPDKVDCQLWARVED